MIRPSKKLRKRVAQLKTKGITKYQRRKRIGRIPFILSKLLTDLPFAPEEMVGKKMAKKIQRQVEEAKRFMIKSEGRKLLHAPGFLTRGYAANALGMTGDVRVIPFLLKGLKD